MCNCEEKKVCDTIVDPRAHYASAVRSSNCHAIKILKGINKRAPCAAAHENSEVDAV